MLPNGQGKRAIKESLFHSCAWYPLPSVVFSFIALNSSDATSLGHLYISLHSHCYEIASSLLLDIEKEKEKGPGRSTRINKQTQLSIACCAFIAQLYARRVSSTNARHRVFRRKLHLHNTRGTVRNTQDARTLRAKLSR